MKGHDALMNLILGWAPKWWDEQVPCVGGKKVGQVPPSMEMEFHANTTSSMHVITNEFQIEMFD